MKEKGSSSKTKGKDCSREDEKKKVVRQGIKRQQHRERQGTAKEKAIKRSHFHSAPKECEVAELK